MMKVSTHGFIENHLQLVKTYVIVIYVRSIGIFLPIYMLMTSFFLPINVTLQFIQNYGIMLFIYINKQGRS